MRLSKVLGCRFDFELDARVLRYNPEVRLMSLLVVAIKLSQGFEASECFPRVSEEPATVRLNWEKWGEAIQDRVSPLDDDLHLQSAEGLQGGEEIKLTEDRALRATGKQLDQYMDWYTERYVHPERQRRESRYAPFPNPATDSSVVSC
jgi:hypothetical protein